MNAPLVIVGASLAGVRTIEELRAHGFDQHTVMIGEEPKLPYDRPPLSKGFLTGEVGEDSLILAGDDRLAELGVELVSGERAKGLDLAAQRVRLEGGEEQPFGQLVIATGSAPRVAPWQRPISGVTPLRTVTDAIRLRDLMAPGRHLIVVGGGFIGTETAATAGAMGLPTTVLDADAFPLRRAFGAEVGDALRGLHEHRGVSFRGGVLVTELLGGEQAEGVRLNDGTTIEGDIVLVATGSDPAIGWLVGSGLDLAQGVSCDESGRAAATVWAAGDVAVHAPRRRATAHWTDAVESARTVARDILRAGGADIPAPRVTLPYFWTDQYEYKIQSVGTVIGHDECRIISGTVASGDLVAAYGLKGRMVGAVTVNRPRELALLRRSITTGAPIAAPIPA